MSKLRLYGAEETVGTTPGGYTITRLESAEMERRDLVAQELTRHTDALASEAKRHDREMRYLGHVFTTRLGNEEPFDG